jgi:hypothetical protein
VRAVSLIGRSTEPELLVEARRFGILCPQAEAAEPASGCRDDLGD